MTNNPRSIEAIGLQEYLDSTKADHNNKGYDHFKMVVRIATDTSLAKEFGVNRNTIIKWRKIFNKEQDNAK